jgi:hypothetical protein
MLHNPMSTGSIQTDLIVVGLLFIALLILVFVLGRMQTYIDKKVERKLKEESHARHLAKMGKTVEVAPVTKKDGRRAPVAVELHDEAMRQKIEQLRQDQLKK